jgi:hypothetical protein
LDHPPHEARDALATLFHWIDVGFFSEQRLAYRAWRNICLGLLLRLKPMLQAVPTEQVGALRELGTTSNNMVTTKLAHKFVYKFIVRDELICRNFEVGGIRGKVHIVFVNEKTTSKTRCARQKTKFTARAIQKFVK